MLESSLYFQFFCGIGVVTVVIAYASGVSRHRKLDHIPTVGSSGLLGSYWSAIRFVTNGMQIVQEGFDKYKTSAFKVSTLNAWTVVLNPKHLDEIAKFPGEVLSFSEAMNDLMKFNYTLGPQILQSPYHIEIARTRFNRNLSVLLPGMIDEMVTTLDELLDLQPNEWKDLSVAASIQKLIGRISNRTMIGLPLCRDPDWLDLTVNIPQAIMIEAFIIGNLPDFVIPLAAKLFTKTSSRIRRGAKLLDPIIKERQRCMQEYGEGWTDRPSDILQWCLDHGDETTTQLLTTRLLIFAFAAIISSSLAFGKVLCSLAANPQYVQPLREEVEMALGESGWTRDAIAKLRKIDSFIKEGVRFEGTGIFGVQRKAMKDVTLSDGTFIPQGTQVAVAAYAIEHDDSTFENPHIFDPFRFVDLQDRCGDPSKYQFTSVSHDLLVFGIGKSACPGRFLAAMMLKVLLAHIVTTYDLKPGEGFSKSVQVNGTLITSPATKILFRKRTS